MTVRIVTDSSCDLPQQVADSLGISIVPLKISFGHEEYVDRTTITADEFWRKCAASAELPQTAAPSEGDFAKVYQQLKSEGATGIVVIALSSSLSATMQSAVNAAKSMAETIDIRVVDSRNASLGVGLTAVECAERARAGDPIDRIVKIGRAHV